MSQIPDVNRELAEVRAMFAVFDVRRRKRGPQCAARATKGPSSASFRQSMMHAASSRATASTIARSLTAANDWHDTQRQHVNQTH